MVAFIEENALGWPATHAPVARELMRFRLTPSNTQYLAAVADI
ncbi:MAG: hypothetical protein ABSG96_07115 [Terracidiphilus sp.]